MASQNHKDAKSSSNNDELKVTRIKAEDSTKNAKKVSLFKRSKDQKVKLPKGERSKIEKPSKNPFVLFWNYIKGSWHELRQVRWPDRKNTWKMTGALLLFTLFFVVLVLLLDAGFKWLFQQILS